MIVDSSALVAVIKREKDWISLSQVMDNAADLSISAASYFETAIVVDGLRDPVQSARLDELLLDMEMIVEPVTAEQARILLGGGGSLDETVEFLRTSSIGRTSLTGVDPGTAARALASVRAALAPHADDEGVRLNAAVWLVKATA